MIGKKMSCTIMTITIAILAVIIVILSGLVVIFGKNIRSSVEILEIREDGSAEWFNDPIKLHDNYRPTSKVISRAVEDFIKGAREVHGFFDTNADNVQRMLSLASGKGYAQIESWIFDNNPFKLKDSISVSIPRNSIRTTNMGDGVWKAWWRERTYDKKGNKIAEDEYEGVFHIEIMNNGEPSKWNPFGIYIVEYDIDLLRRLM